MQTVLPLGPQDAGQELTEEEYETARCREGYRYELIDGRLVVSPAPELPHDEIVDWVGEFLNAYRRACPQVINRVATRARVYVPGRPGLTCPEPDLAVYHDFPARSQRRFARWRNVTPILVVEVVSDDNGDKDLVRNVALYAQVSAIQEYWIIDDRGDDEHFLLRVYRRGRGRRWRSPIDLRLGETYATPLLPGFSLPIDPDARP